MKVKTKKFSFDSIERSSEIQAWLQQFPSDKQGTAADILLKLQFITRDTYAEWLKSILLALKSPHCAVYAVRKFDSNVKCLWDVNGETVGRPSTSLGSEDLVQSVIANLKKVDPKRFWDHPSLAAVRKNKIHDIVLLDDSIGSGQRVSSFIQLMMVNRTFRSWWSLGWIRLYIFAFARSVDAEERIIRSIPGSEHHTRKFPKSSKVLIYGPIAHQDGRRESRWGINYQSIVDLCRSKKEIPATYRLGYGDTMANIVFYHSVPDNIPGILWYSKSKWIPLFPGRSVPDWLPRVLEGDFSNYKPPSQFKPSDELIAILRLVKRGVRNANSLAHSLGVDPRVLKQFVAQGKAAGLLTDTNRITEAGFRILRAEKSDDTRPFDRSLFIPRISCVGWGTVQPSAPDQPVQTDSTVDSSTGDGEVGQTSLERTDAKTASPSLGVMPQDPAKPRMGHDAHGPRGLKER
jgi:hypothetical protein